MSTRYLPFHRAGAASLLSGDPTGEHAAISSLRVSIIANKAEKEQVAIPALKLAGPGDVLGLAAGQVHRAWPPAGCQDAEENLLPLLELSAPDLPWRYSPVTPMSDRLTPWVVLLALRLDWQGRGEDEPEAALLGSADPSAGLPPRVWIRQGTPLPKLDHAWAWAHVEQLCPDGAPPPVSASNARARMLCPRKLDPETRYLMVLVPVFQRGVQAGLGQRVDANATARAWPPAAGWTGDDRHVKVGGADGLTLPVYHHWTFKTGAPGDVERLARELRAAGELPPEVGTLELRLTLPVPGGDRTITMETALGDVRAADQPAPPEPGVRTRAQVVEALGLDMPAIDPQTGDPLIRPPMYGEHHILARRGIRPALGRTSDQVVSPTGTGWFHVLNADPRWRVVAGIGAEVVRRHQEEYMEEAWKWLSDNRVALARDQLRQQLQWSWRQRAVAPAARRLRRQLAADPRAGEIQGADAALRLAPLLGKVLVGASGRSAQLSVAARRALRPTGRRGKAAAALLDEAGRTSGFAALTYRAEALGRLVAAGGKTEEEQRKYLPVRLSLVKPGMAIVPTAGAAKTQQSALSPALAKLARLAVVEPDPPDPLLAPAIDEATSLRLREISEDWLLAGAGQLAENRVYLLQPNQRFIEAFMVGMNHEMCRELLWREFPTDGRATVFSRFWDSLQEEPKAAITKLHTWTAASRLGEHGTPGSSPTVLLIRSPIVRRYPKLVLFLGRFTRAQEVFTPVAGAAVVEPQFKGQLGEDVSFFGFTLPTELQQGLKGGGITGDDWYFVLQEVPGAPRFGLDLRARGWEKDATLYSPKPTTPGELDWTHLGGPMLAPVDANLKYLDIDADGTLADLKADGTPTRTLRVTSASFAACTVQQPIQVFIPFNLLLRQP